MRKPSCRSTWTSFVWAGALGLGLAACSVRKLAVNALSGALSEGGAVFAMDEDPDFVREAMPFALKAIEALIVEAPENPRLLIAACSGFTQYANAFLETDAYLCEQDDYGRAVVLRGRAFRMYLRALDYGLRALELEHPGIGERLQREPGAAAAEIDADEVEAAFWTGASWGAAVSLALDRPEVLADLEAVRALLARVLELDEAYDGIHDVLIAIEALPEVMGGSPERARWHFERALELSGGTRATPYVTMATEVALPAQDRAAFVELLELALTVDLEADTTVRLANELQQRRARHLLGRLDELFLEPVE